jgi:flavodoxin
MPSCAILYYSTTGNTKLACEYIVNRIPQVDFELFDMKDLSSFDPGRYTFIGFATYTDYQAPPKFFVDTISTIGPLNAKDSFIFATYAGLPGKILSGIKKAVE